MLEAIISGCIALKMRLRSHVGLFVRKLNAYQDGFSRITSATEASFAYYNMLERKAKKPRP